MRKAGEKIRMSRSYRRFLLSFLIVLVLPIAFFVFLFMENYRGIYREKILEQENGILSCHRSFLVNLQHVSSITKTEFVMDNNMRIPISRGNIRKANAAFLKYYTS